MGFISGGGIDPDNVTIETNVSGKLAITPNYQVDIEQEQIQNIEIIELQANASITPMDHDTFISDTVSGSSSGYKNTVIPPVTLSNTNVTASSSENGYIYVSDQTNVSICKSTKYVADTGEQIYFFKMKWTRTLDHHFQLGVGNSALSNIGSNNGTSYIISLNANTNPITQVLEYNNNSLTLNTGYISGIPEPGDGIYSFKIIIDPVKGAKYYLKTESDTTDVIVDSGWTALYDSTPTGNNNGRSADGTTLAQFFRGRNADTNIRMYYMKQNDGDVTYSCSDFSASGSAVSTATYSSNEYTDGNVLFDLGTISGTVTDFMLVCNGTDVSNCTYSITDGTSTQSSLNLNEKVASTLSGNPTQITLTVPASDNFKSYCLKLWKS